MNRALVAVAGAGKTERLAEAVVGGPRPDRTLILTYTTTNQREDAARIALKARDPLECPAVAGWRSFLLNEIVLPYLPALYPEIELKGLAPNDPKSFRYLYGTARYLSQDGRAYPSLLGKLSMDVIKASSGAAIDRLECLYDKFYIDEAQDLRGNDLCVLEKLLRSSIDMRIVLDPRQSTLNTAAQDRMHKKYECAKVIELYRLWERKGLLEIEYERETHRFIPQIAEFSDLVFDDGLGLGQTVSYVEPRGFHDGVYIIGKTDVDRYVAEYKPAVLALQKSDELGYADSYNFGKSKGLTRDDILIIATKPIERFLRTGKALEPKSACGFYVAVTRARYSVAVAVSNPNKTIAAMRAAESHWYSVMAKGV